MQTLPRLAAQLLSPTRRHLRHLRRSHTPPSMSTLVNADPNQAALMAERVILVDPTDHPQGDLSKHAAHLVETGLPLHRAFSVFLFDSQNRLLIQQRASTKVTYPNYWANTCCSHPLHTPRELGAPDPPPQSATVAPTPTPTAAPATPSTPAGRTPFSPLPPPEPAVPAQDPVLGVKRAAVRKLEHELGIPAGTVPEHSLHYLTRVHYRAACDDGVWGEHELDYVLFARAGKEGVEISPEENEVQEARWVTEAQLRTMFVAAEKSQRARQERAVAASRGWLAGVEDRANANANRANTNANANANANAVREGSDEVLISPWFKIIMDRFGWTWWDQLNGSGESGVLALVDHDKILLAGDCEKGCVGYAFHPTLNHPS